MKNVFGLLLTVLLLSEASSIQAQPAVTWKKTPLQGAGMITSIAAYGGLVLAGTYTKGIYQSADGGGSWEQVNNGLTSMEIHALIIDDMHGVVIAGTARGAFKSTDWGTTWLPINGGLSSSGQNIEALAIMAANGLIAAGTNDGVYYLSPNASSWTAAGLQGKQVMAVTFDNASQIYAATVLPDALYHAAITSKNWTRSLTSITGVLAMTASTPQRIFAASSTVYASTDMGTTWNPTSYTSTIIFTLIHGLSGEIFVGDEGGVSASYNGGSTWAHLGIGEAPSQATALAIDDQGTLFAGTYGGAVYTSGTFSSGVDGAVTGVEAGSLGQSYPNPAQAQTTIPFSLRHGSDVRMTIVDPLGRTITTITPGRLEAGPHTLDIDLGPIRSGVYLYRLQADGIDATRMMTIVR